MRITDSDPAPERASERKIRRPAFRNVLGLACVVLILPHPNTALGSAWQQDSAGQEYSRGLYVGKHPENDGESSRKPPRCISAGQEARMLEALARFRAAQPEAVARGVIQRLPFYPVAGTLFADVGIGNYVDLSISSQILSWDCNSIAYDGHNGHDTYLEGGGWLVKDYGLPIFSPYDGTVVEAHDGEFDMNTTVDGSPANYVTLDHGAGFQTAYVHLKRGSVDVRNGQRIKAGTLLGMAASSGNSTGPHLHFGMYLNGLLLEPFAGPCRPGPSYWIEQPEVPDGVHVYRLYFTREDFANYPDPVLDPMPHTGTFVVGEPVRWVMAWGSPTVQDLNFRFVRPDGSVGSAGGPIRFPTFGTGTYLFGWGGFDRTGNWAMEFFNETGTVLSFPVTVVGSASEVINRAPYKPRASLEPEQPTEQDVVMVRVAHRHDADPDYDVLRYRYVWTIDGTTVRDVMHAGTVDMLPRGRVTAGQIVQCTVTPYDGALFGPPATAPAPPDTTAPSVHVLSPNGGEKLRAGMPVSVRWESSDAEGIVSHEVQLSLDGGQTYPIVLQAGISGSSTSLDTILPSSIQKSKTARIRVVARDGAGNEASDSSDVNFRIKKAR